MKKPITMLAAGLLTLSGSVFAQDAEPAVVSPLHQGFYLSPLGSYTLTDNRWRTKDGYGGSLAGGYRLGAFALELSGAYSNLGASASPDDVELKSVGLNALVFPFGSYLPDLFGIIGGGYTRGNHLFITVPDTNGPLLPPGASSRTDSFGAQYIQGGLGYVYPLSFGRYDFGIRAQALARYTERSHSASDTADDPRRFTDYVFSLGLQLPLGLRPVPPQPPPEPVQVVPVQPAAPQPQCSDGIDNDGDGKIDFPADKGCTGPEDNDESGPPPCKAPGPGEKLSLAGCGTGDILVLRGVNFDFDKSRLTVNAKRLLDDVASELVHYPDIKVELGGHTDSKGSDAYNQRLSTQRATSVMKYLLEKGIDASRMTAVGFGESRPVADNTTDEGRELNRRVELKIVSGEAAPAATEPAPATTAPAVTEPSPAAAADQPATAAASAEPATTEPASEPAVDAAVDAAAPAEAPAPDAGPADSPAVP